MIKSIFFTALMAIPFTSACKYSSHSETKDLPLTFGVKNVAVLGDSQTAGDYGARLADRIIKDSQQRLLFFGGASSARIHHWIDGNFSAIPSNFFRSCESPGQNSCHPALSPGKKTKSIKSILAQFPEIDGYILTLGDNHYYDPASVKSFTKEISELLIKSQKRCAFVTPTLALGKFANKNQMIEGIKSGLNDVKAQYGRTCVFVDSYTFGGDVVKNSNDKAIIEDSVRGDYMKLHPAGKGAYLWADRVFEKLVNKNFLN
jgi:hypothetical protein